MHQTRWLILSWWSSSPSALWRVDLSLRCLHTGRAHSRLCQGCRLTRNQTSGLWRNTPESTYSGWVDHHSRNTFHQAAVEASEERRASGSKVIPTGSPTPTWTPEASSPRHCFQSRVMKGADPSNTSRPQNLSGSAAPPWAVRPSVGRQ